MNIEDTCTNARRCCTATINRLAWAAPREEVALGEFIACDDCGHLLKLIQRDGLAVWVEFKHRPEPPEEA